MGRRDLIYSVDVQTAQVFRVRAIQPRRTWANATVRSWPGGGSVDIQSDYGNYAYSWSHIGDGHFLDFLCSLDFDYFMGKARPGFREFDAEGTANRIKEHIVDERRHGGLEHDQARELFDEVCRYDVYSGLSADALAGQISREMWKFLDGDFPTMTTPSPQSRGFWRCIWPMLVGAWRDAPKGPTGEAEF